MLLRLKTRFRPLTGINFNPYGDIDAAVLYCFRPLTGINFNIEKAIAYYVRNGFRPLTGINFNQIIL